MMDFASALPVSWRQQQQSEVIRYEKGNYYIIAYRSYGYLALSACQKTPDSPIVVGKDNEKLIEKAVASSDTPFSAPSRYSADEPLTNPQGSLTVNVDAAVIVPNSDELSTARVEKHLFTEAECQTYITALFDSQATYSGDVFETKAYYQQTILEWQRQLALKQMNR